MKFKLVENINGGHENVSSNDILTEGQWYKIEYDGTNPDTKVTFSDNVYVWAKNDNSKSVGIKQAEEIFNSAVAGNYTGRNKEQSFNHKVADRLNYYKGNIRTILPQASTFTPSYNDNVLSKNDRDFRDQADKMLHNSLSTYCQTLPQSDFKQKLQSIECDKFFKHHLNEQEKDNVIDNLLIIPYDSNTLGLAHTAHTLIHYVKDNVGNIHFGKWDIPIYDLRNKRIFTMTVKLSK